MKTLEDFTPEIQAKIPEYIDRVVQPIYAGDRYRDFDFKKAEAYIHFMYEFCSHNPPKVEVVENLQELNEIGKQLAGIPQDEKANKLEYLFACDVYANVYFTWYKFIKDELKIEEDAVIEYGQGQKEKLGVILDKFHDMYMVSGIYSGIYRKDVCYVSKYPKSINIDDQNRLHCEDGPAVEWGGKPFDCYYWKGYNVPKELIEAPETLTADWIKEHAENLEMRRCIIEKIGVDQYFKLLSGGEGLKIIDEVTDNQGNPMKLYEFEFGGKMVQSLEVVDPSTGRVYNFTAPDECKTAWEAKRSSFSNKGIKYRHGDVGIVEIGEDYEKPLIET